jgi:MauM/NapG family ferredoxin protein
MRTYWRRASQLIFLAIFIYLFYITQYPLDFSHTNILVRLSPLVMATNALITHSFSLKFIPAILIIIVTIFLGRVFCGWVCPVGTLLDLVPKTKKRLSYIKLKYYILVFLIIVSALGFNLLVITDPLVIFTRSLTFITQVTPPVVFIIIMGLVAVLGERYWCRVLCPLGALLGVCSSGKVVNLHIGETCTHCNICTTVCPMDAIHSNTISKTECTLCLKCIEKCPKNTITISLGNPSKPLQSASRRTFLKAGIAAGAALVLSPLLKAQTTHIPVIRPPGALKEENFLSVCIRCGECMRVCPSQGLRPVLFEGSLYSLYTPKLVPRIGECQLCMLCWQVCPTGALIEVDPAKMKLGTATVNRDTCLVWDLNETCWICQEVCPYQAVESAGGERRGQRHGAEEGEERRGPKVNRSLCAGCGTCENKCPVEPAAITVSPEGEIRY